MAIRFRKTVRIAPGLKLNIGKKSASVRVGGKNFGYTTGTKGKTVSASLPGTGLGVTHRVKGSAEPDLDWFRIARWGAIICIGLLVIGLMLLTGRPKP
jgi:hypothetical protein